MDIILYPRIYIYTYNCVQNLHLYNYISIFLISVIRCLILYKFVNMYKTLNNSTHPDNLNMLYVVFIRYYYYLKCFESLI